jgi:hypothetical protein
VLRLYSTRLHIRLRTLRYRILDLYLYPHSRILGYQHTLKVLLNLNILVYYIKLEKRDRYRTLHPSATDLAQATIVFTAEDNIDVYFHH